MKSEPINTFKPRSLADVLSDLDKVSSEALAMIVKQDDRHSSVAVDHASLCAVEVSITRRSLFY
jgi:hypothetical protein